MTQLGLRPAPSSDPGQVFADFVIDKQLGSQPDGVDLPEGPAVRCTAPRHSR